MTRLGTFLLGILIFDLGLLWVIRLWNSESYFWCGMLSFAIYDNMGWIQRAIMAFFLPVEKEETNE